MHLDLSEYMSATYPQVTSSSYNTPAEIYIANNAPHSQHIYDGPMDDQYTHNPGDWMYSHVPTYSPQGPTIRMVANGIRATHYSSPPSESPASHYASGLGYPPSRPTLSRQSSQRSWHSEQGLDTQADGNQRATRSLQGTPLATIPMLPSLAGSNHFSSSTLIPQGLGDKKGSVSSPEQPDPFAAVYLREQLGEEKWDIFTSRLAENRKNGSRSRMKVALTAAIESGNTDFTDFGGASAIDFLVKVEVVKCVLRTFVPHPYNPQKSMSHPYNTSPKGHVVISRSSVLTLSGWSNTQFAYWARRAEGVSVLCNRDTKLRAVAKALEQRLREVGLFESSPILPDLSSESSGDDGGTSFKTPVFSSIDRLIMPKDEPLDEKLAIDEIEMMDPDRWVKTFVTGKGLDVIIDEVKKRCGVSQFLRGKHSSLDAFGSTVDDGTGSAVRREASQVFMPTFQAESYVHEAPSVHAGLGNTDEVSSPTTPAEISGTIKRKASPGPSVSLAAHISNPSVSVDIPFPEPSKAIDFTGYSSRSTTTESPISPISPLSPITPHSFSAVSDSGSFSDPLVRQPSPTTRVHHTPMTTLASPTSLHPYDSPLSETAKLNAQFTRLGDPAYSSHYPFTHPQQISPNSNGVFRQGADHYRHSHVHHHIHGLRMTQEFEQAQTRSARQFNLSIPQPHGERRLKKQKVEADDGTCALVTLPMQRSQLTDEYQPLGHGTDHMRGFYPVSRQTDNGLSSAESWHGHNATSA
ncbi:hypothetical protein EUX98_g279 [Antrodiella citrinella]|uniref:Uncharacterized protein n=1 Tax=Antrodiella citrinella TaxID=2447956 RepID=A0A4S4N493_9APHY|nr:hypothetical protein EUX98_g279 [Antrodiella citrinella]